MFNASQSRGFDTYYQRRLKVGVSNRFHVSCCAMRFMELWVSCELDGIQDGRIGFVVSLLNLLY